MQVAVTPDGTHTVVDTSQPCTPSAQGSGVGEWVGLVLGVAVGTGGSPPVGVQDSGSDFAAFSSV